MLLLKTGVINPFLNLSGMFPLINVKLKVGESGSDISLAAFLIAFH